MVVLGELVKSSIQRLFNMTSKVTCFGVLIVIVATTIRFTLATEEAPELFNIDDNPIPISQKFPTMIKLMPSTLEETESNANCHLEYQVTKRRTGRCVKLSQGMSGCVSGPYLDPFHPDCI